MIYDSNWDEVPYFVSTSKTAFAMSFMHQFDAELLLGQITYKQKSDIYNYHHQYERIEKSQSVKHGSYDFSEGDDDFYTSHEQR